MTGKRKKLGTEDSAKMNTFDSAQEKSLIQGFSELTKTKIPIDLNAKEFTTDAEENLHSKIYKFGPRVNIALLSRKEVTLYDGNLSIPFTLVAGQVGRIDIVGSDFEPYEVSFYDATKINFFENTPQDDYDDPVFISSGLMANEFLVLSTDYNLDVSASKNIYTEENFKKDENFRSLDEINNFLKKTMQSLNKKILNKENFKPGQLVTVITDFMIEQNNGFEIKISKGHIGFIVNSEINKIIDETSQETATIAELIKYGILEQYDEDEVVVHFPKLHLWDLLEASKTQYIEIEPFDQNECFILNKAYLLPLFLEQVK